MVSNEILSSYIGSEIMVRFINNGHSIGRLEKVDKDAVLLKLDNGNTEMVPKTQIKYIESRPPWHREFETAALSSIAKLLESGKAKNEKDAIELLKNAFKVKNRRK